MFAVYSMIRDYWEAEVLHGIICVMQRNTPVVTFPLLLMRLMAKRGDRIHHHGSPPF